MPKDKHLEAVFRLMHAIKSQFSAELSAENVPLAPMHVKVLKKLNRQSSCTARDIGMSFRRDKAQIARLIHDLSDAGLVVRAPNPQDKRSQIISLSDSGRELLSKTEAIDKRVIKKMFNGVEQADQAAFLRLARQLHDNLESD
ncbi:MAG: MarR family winged helix-turn-helix transcriptional regulator [Woeseiaceae bacterium]